MQSATPLPSYHPSALCWICGKSASWDDPRQDEHRHLVHEKCYELRLQLRSYNVESKAERTLTTQDKRANA